MIQLLRQVCPAKFGLVNKWFLSAANDCLLMATEKLYQLYMLIVTRMGLDGLGYNSPERGGAQLPVRDYIEKNLSPRIS